MICSSVQQNGCITGLESNTVSLSGVAESLVVSTAEEAVHCCIG